MLRGFFIAYILIFAFGVSAANASPCPMSDGAADAHTHNHHGADYPQPQSHHDCGYSSFAECLDLQEASAEHKKTGKTEHFITADMRPRTVLYKTGVAEIKTEPSANLKNRRLKPVYLITQHILV